MLVVTVEKLSRRPPIIVADKMQKNWKKQTTKPGKNHVNSILDSKHNN